MGDVAVEGGTLCIGSSGSTASGGSTTSTGSAFAFEAGVRATFRHSRRLRFETRVELDDTPGGLAVGLHRAPDYTELNPTVGTPPGGVLVATTGETVVVTVADERGEWVTETTRSLPEALAAGVVDIVVTTDHVDRQVTVGVAGGDDRVVCSRAYPDVEFSGPWGPSLSAAGGSVCVHCATVYVPDTVDRRLWPDGVYVVLEGQQVTDPPFADPHPKEPAGIHVDGTFYLAACPWSGYAPSERPEKDIVLFEGPTPLGPFRQTSLVTDVDGSPRDAPGLAHVDGRLWVLVSDREEQVVRGLSADIGAIPEKPAGWTDEGALFAGVDPKSVWRQDRIVYVAYHDKYDSGDTHMASGPSLVELTRDTKLYAGPKDGMGWVGQAPDVLPDGEGGWLLSTFVNPAWGRGSVAARADRIDGSYKTTTPAVHMWPGALTGHAAADPGHCWFGDWVVQHATLKTADMTALYDWNGRHITHIEGGDGRQHRCGALTVPTESVRPVRGTHGRR